MPCYSSTCSSAVAQGQSIELSTKRTRVRIMCCRVKPWARFFNLHCSTSLSSMSEYLAIDSDDYLCTSRAVFAKLPRG
ncbi:hypothetical protein NP493_472g00019 [Ridgeia piscesae]|uniref:Uncharacterized protein n=1 Tax=Ridgeia piscesae TaxID=27915 RepID=A0AAD9NT71_RIDPI|nr:hypothetical protein NP493_472g00019 [Ridgeia piscesae]